MKLFFVFFCAFAITGVSHGTGQHADTLPPTEIPVGLKVRILAFQRYVSSG
jgi:hypothetical protein